MIAGLLVGVGLAAAVGTVVVAPVGVAGADPPGPTDFETVVLGIEPETPSIEVAVIGGDSFVQLTVAPGTEVVVLGYDAEPYLRFSADGVVEENRQSPTLALNEDRYGTASPGTGDPSAPPEWAIVATAGRYAWHDHRAHWMSRDDPTGYERGDRIQDGQIPLHVDGREVIISVATVWLDEPSQMPVAAGAILAVFAVLIVVSVRWRVAWALVAASVAAAGIGWWQVASVPAETGPSSIWWLLPAVAGASGLIAVVLGRSLVSHALVVLGGIELALWAYLRRDGLARATLPTDAPFWLDRGVTSAAAIAAVIVVAASTVAMLRTEVSTR